MQPTTQIQLIIKQEAHRRKQSGWRVLIFYIMRFKILGTLWATPGQLRDSFTFCIIRLPGRTNKTMDNFIVQCSWREIELGTGQTRRKECWLFHFYQQYKGLNTRSYKLKRFLTKSDIFCIVRVFCRCFCKRN